MKSYIQHHTYSLSFYYASSTPLMLFEGGKESGLPGKKKNLSAYFTGSFTKPLCFDDPRVSGSKVHDRICQNLTINSATVLQTCCSPHHSLRPLRLNKLIVTYCLTMLKCEIVEDEKADYAVSHTSGVPGTNTTQGNATVGGLIAEDNLSYKL